MKLVIRLDGFPIYAFVPEWMVIFYLTIIAIFWYGIIGTWYRLKEKYNG